MFIRLLSEDLLFFRSATSFETVCIYYSTSLVNQIGKELIDSRTSLHCTGYSGGSRQNFHQVLSQKNLVKMKLLSTTFTQFEL